MIRHSRPRKTEQDTAIAKARLRVAALQVSPLDVIREHPWASVLGTAAASMTAAALLSGPPKTKVIYRGVTPDGKVVEDNGRLGKDHSQEKKRGMLALLSSGILGQLTGVGVTLLRDYLEGKMHQAGTAVPNGRMKGAAGDAMG